MSQKLPVGDVLNEAVQFGLHRWGAVLRFGWLPTVVASFMFGAYLAVVFGAALFVDYTQDTELAAFEAGMRVSIPIAVVAGVLVYTVALFLFCGVIASLYRLVALGEDRPGIFHLRTDGPAKRVFLAFLIVWILNLIIWAAAFMAALAFSDATPTSVAGAFKDFLRIANAAETGESNDREAFMAMLPLMKVFLLTGLISLIPMLYVNIKLAPFPAGSAAENRLLLLGSFSMTRGSFWSILGIYVLLFLFMVVISIIYQLTLTIFQLIAGFLAGQGGAFALIGAGLFIVIVAASLFFNLFTFGVQTATQAIIYRRLKTGE